MLQEKAVSTIPTALVSLFRVLRVWRRQLDPCVSVLGILVILGALLFVQELRIQILVTTCGMLMIEAGVWLLAQRLLPSERRYHALRTEVDQFLQLVRALNTVALSLKAHDVPDTQQALAEIHQAMQQSVARMTTLAGKTDTELAAEHACPPLLKTL
jgi:membrane-bound ClpP family serine protease